MSDKPTSLFQPSSLFHRDASVMDDGSMFYATAAEAIDSKLPLRPPRALNCGMALKRQETDHGKRKTKVPGPLWLTRG